MSKDYVSFHNHTSFSLMDSLSSPKEIFAKAKELNQSAIAITDHGTLAAAHDSLKESKATGVKLIMGCEFYFTDDLSDPAARLRHVILCSINHEGYRNLLRLHFEAGRNHTVLFKKVVPRIDWKLMEQYSKGLICTTACGGGILGQLINTRKLDLARQQAKRLKGIFEERLALEVQPNSIRRTANAYKDYEDQTFTNHQIIKLGKELDIKVIAATDSHYINRSDAEAHDVQIAIGSGQPIYSGQRMNYMVKDVEGGDFYMKSREEVLSHFIKRYPQAEEFLDNTLFFSDMCEQPNWIDPKFTNPSGKELPEFPVKDQADYQQYLSWRDKNNLSTIEDDKGYLRFKCEEGFVLRGLDPNDPVYRARLTEELDVLEYQNFSSYMIIVSDLFDFCAKNNIMTGPGRGSVGGSLIAYLIGIHEGNPLQYGLIFARFHNKERTSPPDCDNDVSPEGLAPLFKYMQDKYDIENVAKISNYITMSPRPYIKDIARTFQYGGDRQAAVAVGAAISQSVPEDPSDNNTKSVMLALEAFPLFAEYADSPKYNELRKYSAILDNKPKAIGMHAAGVVISKRPLVDIIPLRTDADGIISVEYEKERTEEVGLVKMDWLGLKTLSVIKITHELIASLGKPLPPSPFPYGMADKETYDLISRGELEGVFQLGTSPGTINLCKQIKPQSIEDLAIITTLARPAAKDIRQAFIETREGKKKFALLHPSLAGAFKNTFGFGLYDESILQLGRDVAGWSFNEADRIRKLIKEKGRYPEKVKKLRAEFIEGAVTNNNIDKKMATRIWDEEIKKFGGYSFNKSHAILYSFTSFETAYLRTHYPLEFLVANLISKVGSSAGRDKDQVSTIKRKIRTLGIKLLPPDINRSNTTYTIIDDKTLMIGFDALKYCGKNSIPEILEKRPFKSFEDFLLRVDASKVSMPTIHALAAAGCLDSFNISRKQCFLYAEDFRKKLKAFENRKRKSGEFKYPWVEEKEWLPSEVYALEKFYIGEAVSVTKQQAYRGFFAPTDIPFEKYKEIFPNPNKSDRKYHVDQLKGIIIDHHEFTIKKQESKIFGQTMAKVRLEDQFGQDIVITVFPDSLKMLKSKIKMFSKGKSTLEEGVGLIVDGDLNWYDNELGFVLGDVLSVIPPLQLPKDLSSKKVKMAYANLVTETDVLNADELLEDIEESLIMDGNDDSNEENLHI
jgi:DNA polymerase-3 subunit alpha